MSLRPKILISDVDGVLTDGQMYWSAQGNIIKVFHSRDGIGFKIAKKAGLKLAFVSAGPAKDVLESRGQHLQIDYIHANVSDKVTVIEQILQKEAICWDEVIYIGDDLPDIACLQKAGHSFCPQDASREAKDVSKHILNTPGGKGCIRELVLFLKLDQF